MLQFSPVTVQSFSSLTIGRVGFFGCVKRTQVVPVSVELNSRYIFFAFSYVRHSFVAACVVFLWSSVAVVLRRSGVPQIFPTVVGLIFVDVVDFVLRPFAFHVQPSKSVRHIVFVGEPYFYPAFVLFPTRYVAGSSFATRFSPAKYAGGRIVMENGFKLFTAQIGKCVLVPAFHTALLILVSGRVKGAT